MSAIGSPEARQAAVVAALESGAAIPDGRPRRRIDTHMSHLFIGETDVYKLKRAVSHPFADLSGLEARRSACQAELEVNARLAPQLYVGVAPVVRAVDGEIRVGGAGEVVDWVVKLKRFDDGALFSELAAQGRLTEAMVCEAVDAVAAFHAESAPHLETGHAVDYRRVAEGLRRTEAEACARLGLAPASQPLLLAIEHEIARLTPLIEARRRAGQVRRGHGDLHLRNICLFDGRATPFDALEFDPALATTDVLYDIAFLILDLRAVGADDLAEAARRRYWRAAAQPDAALALLPLFMALRAAVRTAVAVEAGDLPGAARYRTLGLEILGAADVSPPVWP
jgi:aminoglycoside phosphotransferase family enzyme